MMFGRRGHVTFLEKGFIKRTYASMLVLIIAMVFNSMATGDNEYRAHYDSRMKLSGKLESGKVEMEILVRKAKLPQVGECWKDALDDLRASCGELDDEMQSRLALSFTTCFLEMTGSPRTICDKSTPIKACMSTLDKFERDTFRDYFLHTQDMCYYIQSQIWHLETDRAVNDLQHAAIEMGKTVHEQKSVAESILESQHNAQSVQREMLKENNEMFDKVLHIKTSIEEFGVHAREHRVIFSEIFEKLRKMQELVVWIQGEMSLIDLASFYAVGLLFCYFITASERSHGARIWMILNMALSLILERYLYGNLSDRGGLSPDELLVWIHYFRRVVVAVTGGILIVHLARYRDYQVINNSLLTDMGKRMDDFMLTWQEQFKHLSEHQALPPATRLHQLLNQNEPNAFLTLRVQNDALGMATQTDDDGEYSDNDHEEIEENTNRDDPLLHQLNMENVDETLDSTDEDDGPQDEPVPSTGPTTLQRLVTFFPLTQAAVKTDENNAPSRGVPLVASSESKYNLRDRRTLQSPNHSVEKDVPKPTKRNAKKVPGKAPNTGYYSSDDDI